MESPVCPTDGVPTVKSATLDKSEEDDLLGKVFSDRYRIESELGVGGMGRVYVATQLSIGRAVALKTLLPHLVSDKTHLRRFFQEARAASKMGSPHVVQIHDFGIDDETGIPYISMELLQGENMYDLVARKGWLSERRTAVIAGQIAKALHSAQEGGIVHRDLKPANIFMVNTADGTDFVKVMDFGIAKVLRSDTDSMPSLTGTAMTVGTPSYMAPEQALCEDIDYRTDLYALGCVVHDLLTGTPPFEGTDPLRVMMSHVSASIPILPQTQEDGEKIGTAMRVVHGRLLAKRRMDRPQSIRNLIDVLAAIARGEEVDADEMLKAEVCGDQPATKVPEVPLNDPSATLSALYKQHADGVKGTDTTGVHEKASESDVSSPTISHRRSSTSGQKEIIPEIQATKKRLPLVALGVAIALAAGFVFWDFLDLSGDKTGAPSAQATTKAQPAAVTKNTLEPPDRSKAKLTEKSAPTKAGEEAPEAKAEATKVDDAVDNGGTFVVDTIPGSRVLIDGNIVGGTPYTLKLGANEAAVTLELRAEFHKPRRLIVSPESPKQQIVVLVKKPVDGSKAKAAEIKVMKPKRKRARKVKPRKAKVKKAKKVKKSVAEPW
jgi:serine/threonine protein kinase